MRLPLIALSLAFSLLSSAVSALGGSNIVFDPSNYSENVMTAARALKSNLNEAMTIANQAQQLANEARNLVTFPVTYWTRLQAQYEQLRMLAEGNASIGQFLQRVDSQFNSIYPNYQAVQNYGKAFEAWTGNALKTAESVMKTANSQRTLVESTTSRTQDIVASSAAGVGMTQQIQSQVAISAQMVGQLEQLRLLQSEQAIRPGRSR